MVSGTSGTGSVSTTDNTATEIFEYVTENNKCYHVEFFVYAKRTDGAGAFVGKYFMLVQNIGGTASIVNNLEVIYRKRTEAVLNVTATPVAGNVEIDVLGKVGQDWDWTISLFTFEVLG